MQTIPLRGIQSAALLYDVHGNRAALDAVLDDVDQRDLDAIVLGGDYALKGPDPSGAVRRLRELDAPAIMGNTDAYLLTDDAPHGNDPVVQWTREQLSDDALRWLYERPFGCRLSPTASRASERELLAVHATPTSLESLLLVEPHPFEGWSMPDDEEARAMLGDAMAHLVTYGHIHVASSGRVGPQRVRSIGSVGMPWDGDPRAAYGIARWEDDEWTVEDVRVDYDWASVADELEASGAPRAEARAESVRTARFDPLAQDG